MPGTTTRPTRPCPNCDYRGRPLDSTNHASYVDYYICDHCGWVWSHKTGDPDAPAVNVAYRRSVERRH